MAHILAVDDDADLRAVIAEALGRDGHFVRLLPAGAEVTEAHCRWADLILLDLRMPGEDGAATCRRIRALTDAPILFLTALNAEADVLEALGSGGGGPTAQPLPVGGARRRGAAPRPHPRPPTPPAAAAARPRQGRPAPSARADWPTNRSPPTGCGAPR